MAARFIGLVLVSALGCLAAGCDGVPNNPPAPTRFRVDAVGGSFTSPFPSQLDVLLGPTAVDFRFSATASSDRGAWNLLAPLTGAQALNGRATVPIGTTETEVARLRIDGSKSVQAEIGTLDLVFGGGLSSGTVANAFPDLLDGTFAGDFILACWVPPTAIPPNSPSSGAAVSPAGEPLVLDENLASDLCLPFRPLL